MNVPPPFYGSKINLISKAGIRYEGILYTIDPQESTVALAKVKSYGTEDREVERTFPARDEVYEYIIFRGKDIKDLHVCEPPTRSSPSSKETPQVMSQDPAILKVEEQLSGPTSLMGGLPTSQGSMNDAAAQAAAAMLAAQTAFLSGSVGPANLVPTSPAAVGSVPGPSATPPSSVAGGTGTCSGGGVGLGGLNSLLTSPHHSLLQSPPASAGGPGTSTAGQVVTPSSFAEAVAVAAAGSQQGRAGHINLSGAGEQRQRGGRGGSRGGRGGRGSGNDEMGWGSSDRQGGYYRNYHQLSQQQLPQQLIAWQNGDMNYRRIGRRTPLYNLSGFPKFNLNMFLGGGGGHRRGGAYRGGGGGGAGGRGGNRNRGNITKFAEDYDFETANKEIAAELERLSVDHHRNGESGTGSVHGAGTEGSGDANAKEEGENANSPAGSSNGKEADQAGDDDEYYNKSKSFFDNISSEAVDRAQGKTIRSMNRRDERKLNAETFGLSARPPRRNFYGGGGNRGGSYGGGNYYRSGGGGYSGNGSYGGNFGGGGGYGGARSGGYNNYGGGRRGGGSGWY